MENPGSILHRARQNRIRKPAMQIPTAEPQKPALSRYGSGHANYNALMRSHDRMQSRHISRQNKT